MREIFDDAFKNEPLDPTEAARRAVKPQRRKRFYTVVAVAAAAEGHGLLLDGRAIRTPGGRGLQLPTAALAAAVAGEWEAQADVIDPATMPLTRLANTIIDGVVPNADKVAADIGRYLGSDLLCYRAPQPPRLVARQAQAFDPILGFMQERFGAQFLVTHGITFVRQSEEAIARAMAGVPTDPFRLGGLHAMTSLTGSALLALAVLHGRLKVEEAWAAAHLDEDWNMELWGQDDLALARRASRHGEMRAAATMALA